MKASEQNLNETPGRSNTRCSTKPQADQLQPSILDPLRRSSCVSRLGSSPATNLSKERCLFLHIFYEPASVRLSTKVPISTKSMLPTTIVTSSCLLNSSHRAKTLVATTTTTTTGTTTTILSITPASSVESTLARYNDGYRTNPQSSTRALSRQRNSLNVQNYPISAPAPSPPPCQTSQPGSDSSSQFDSNNQTQPQKSEFDLNQRKPTSTTISTNITGCTVSAMISNGQKKDLCKSSKDGFWIESSNFDQQVKITTTGTPIFNHFSPFINPAVVPCGDTLTNNEFDQMPTKSRPRPAVRISSSSSKVSDV